MCATAQVLLNLYFFSSVSCFLKIYAAFFFWEDFFNIFTAHLWMICWLEMGFDLTENHRLIAVLRLEGSSGRSRSNLLLAASSAVSSEKLAQGFIQPGL